MLKFCPLIHMLWASSIVENTLIRQSATQTATLGSFGDASGRASGYIHDGYNTRTETNLELSIEKLIEIAKAGHGLEDLIYRDGVVLYKVLDLLARRRIRKLSPLLL